MNIVKLGESYVNLERVVHIAVEAPDTLKCYTTENNTGWVRCFKVTPEQIAELERRIAATPNS